MEQSSDGESRQAAPGQRPRAAIGLTIAGSDSSGGAGIQADLKTFSAWGVYGASVVTALTAQNTRTVSAVHAAPASFVAEQIERVLDDLDVDAIKIGMLASVGVIDSVADALEAYRHIPIVLDPVMVAKSGDTLLAADASGALAQRLCPLARIITPNVPEAAVLSGGAEARSVEDMIEQAHQLAGMTSGAVLMKGGHLKQSRQGPQHDDTCVDVLLVDGTVHRFSRQRIHTDNTHGTGCTLSSAIAAGLALGASLHDAVESAGSYLHDAILHADELGVGHGHGPVHHFHAHWQRTS